MDQRFYYGPIDPNALADYLVGVFNPRPASYYSHHHTMAQKIIQGERIYVQIMHSGDWGMHEHGALGIHIAHSAGGVSVNMGASDWLDLNETGLAGMLLGALFFPPLLLFPLIHGLTHSTFSQDVWNVIDTYCMQASPRPRATNAPQGFYCSYCGAFNHPEATRCHSCSAPFNVAHAPQTEQSPRWSGEQPAQPSFSTQSPQASAPEPAANVEQSASGAVLVMCPQCKALVVPTNFCGNCAAPLR